MPENWRAKEEDVDAIAAARQEDRLRSSGRI